MEPARDDIPEEEGPEGAANPEPSDLEDTLMKGLADDTRLDHGVPDERESSDFDFIQMSGLTKPETRTAASDKADLDPNVPVSFYEKGVDDVDGSMAPITLEDAPLEDQDEIVRPESPDEAVKPRDSVSNLREIIAELSSELDDEQKARLAQDAGAGATTRAAAEEPTGEASSPAAEPEPAEPPPPEPEPPQAAPEPTPELVDTADPQDAESGWVNRDDSPEIPETAMGAVSEAADPPSQAQSDAADEELLASLEALSAELTTEGAAASDPDSEPPAPTSERPAAYQSPLSEIPRDVVENLSRAPVETTAEEVATLSAEEIERRAQERRTTPGEVDLPSEADLADALEAEEEAQRAANQPSDKPAEPPPPLEPAPESDASVYNKPQSPKQRGQRRRRSKWRRRVQKWAFRAVVVTVLAVGGYFAYDYYRVETATPQQTYNRGASLLAQDQYRQASNAFKAFAARHPRDPLAPEARFMAAYALYLIDENQGDRTDQAYEAAIGLFDEFINEYPSHKKRARAESLIGVLHYRLGDYEQAIRILDDPERRLADPESYLPSLRILARSYERLGEIESARSAYLRAASLEGNYKPQHDYIELASMYVRLAEQTDDKEQRITYQQRAIEQLDYALRVPGLVRSRRKEIERSRDDLKNALQSAGAAVQSSEPDPMDGPERESGNAPEPTAAPSASEAADDSFTVEPNPLAEMNHLSNTAGSSGAGWAPSRDTTGPAAATESTPAPDEQNDAGQTGPAPSEAASTVDEAPED